MDRLPELTDEHEAVLAELRRHGSAPPRYLRAPGRDSARARRLLGDLERHGRVLRVFNAWGPQTPWWWQPAQPTPPAGYALPDIQAGQIWDWGNPDRRVWLQVLAAPDEHALVKVSVRAGEHNHVTVPLAAHYFAPGGGLWLRRRGDVTAFSAQFHCPVHGECTQDMVRTDKTCALCRSGLNRLI